MLWARFWHFSVSSRNKEYQVLKLTVVTSHRPGRKIRALSYLCPQIQTLIYKILTLTVPLNNTEGHYYKLKESVYVYKSVFTKSENARWCFQQGDGALKHLLRIWSKLENSIKMRGFMNNNLCNEQWKYWHRADGRRPAPSRCSY